MSSLKNLPLDKRLYLVYSVIQALVFRLNQKISYYLFQPIIVK